MDLFSQASDIGQELSAMAAKGGRVQEQAIHSLVEAAANLCEAVEALHTRFLSADASLEELVAVQGLKTALKREAMLRSQYPVLMKSTETGNQIPDWSARLSLFPEPLKKANKGTKLHHAQLARLLRGFLRTMDSPLDEFDFVDDDEAEASAALALAKKKGERAFQKELSQRFVDWVKRHYPDIIERTDSPIGRQITAYFARPRDKKSKEIKDPWAVFRDKLVRPNLRRVKF